MQLMETVVNNINTKYMGIKREAETIGNLLKVMEMRGKETESSKNQSRRLIHDKTNTTVFASCQQMQ